MSRTLRRWTGSKPGDDEEMRLRIARELGGTLHGFVDAVGPDGRNVRIHVDDVYRHMWKDHPDRWRDVPLLQACIEEAGEILEMPAGELLYSAELRLGQKGHRAHSHRFATFVEQGDRGRRWETTFEIDRKRLAAYKENAGGIIWPARKHSGHRNPTPTRRLAGDSRSDRAPDAAPCSERSARNHRQHSAVRENPSSAMGDALAIAGGLLVFAVLLNRSREVAA